MKKLVLFLKSYSDDLERVKIFKHSVDLYNDDNIPLFIVVPESDIKLFEKECRTHNEKYDFYILSDESVLKANNIDYTGQNWYTQQLIKLGFYKLNLCENYAIFDSDCYFITHFYKHDFLYDNKIPYFCIKEENSHELTTVKDYFKRHGKLYSFIQPGQVFNRTILVDMEKNLLNKKKINFSDLLKISPYEFQWYAEWFLKCKKIQLIWTKGITKVFWFEDQYIREQKQGMTTDDFIHQGWKVLCVQNRWCHHLVYKPHKFYRFIKWKNSLYIKWNHPDIYRKNILKHIFRFIRKSRKVKW